VIPSISTILYVCMSVFGLAWIIADSKISLPIRKKIAAQVGEASLILTLLECPPCLSFWLGGIVGVVMGLGLGAVGLAFVCVAFSLIAWSFVGGES
jgi:hypothetical protein